MDKILFILLLFFISLSASNTSHLNKQEINYLKQNQNFTICEQYNIYPLSGVLNGKLIGMRGEYVNRVEKELGIKFKVLGANNPKELLQNVKAGKCDLLGSLASNQKRFPSIKNTDTVMEFSYGIMGDIKSFNMAPYSDLSEHTFIVRFKAIKNKIQKQYPKLNIIVINNIDEAISKVKGKTHFVALKPVTERVIQEYGFDKYKLNGIFEGVKQQSTMGVNEKHPILLSIINKTISNIEPSFLNIIYDKYTIKEFTVVNNYQYLWYLLLAFSISLVLLFSRYKFIKEKNTQIKKLNQFLELQSKKLNEAQSIAKIGSWELDLKTNKLEWSNEVYNIFELNKKTFSPSYETFLDQIYIEDRNSVNELFFNSLNESSHKSITYRIINTNGTKWVKVQCKTIFDDKNTPITTTGTIQDITKEKRSKDRLEDLTSTLDDAVKISNLGTWEWDPEKNITTWSKITYNIYGIAYDRFINLEFIETLIYEDDLEKHKSEVSNSLKNHTPFDFEYRIRNNNEIKTIHAIGNPIIKNNKIVKFVGVVRDITQQKQLEDQSRLASLGEMMGNIAHQWRQPLNVITTCASGLKFLQEMQGNIEKDKLIFSTDKIIEQAKYLSKTIDDFRNFVKDDKEFKTISVKEIIQSSLNLVSANLKDNYIDLVLELKEDMEIFGNKNELQQAFLNILNNSIDIIKDKVKNDNEKVIFISTKKPQEDELQLEILDTGGGIDEENIKKIFDPYFTTKHQSVGTGLGLSMCNKIIRERHKFDIAVNNKKFNYKEKELKGANFTIHFTKSNKK